jgi:hypothetical protein
MDAVAIVSVTASAAVGALGVLVPTIQASKLERYRQESAHNSWVSDHRISVYKKLLAILDRHAAIDESPQEVCDREYPAALQKWSSQDFHAMASSRPPVSKVSFREMMNWSIERQKILALAKSSTLMWVSRNIQNDWARLVFVATQRDDAMVIAKFEEESTDENSTTVDEILELKEDLSRARDAIKNRIAVDLQGERLFNENR